MYVCILDQQGNILVHCNMPCGADLFLKAVAPYRESLAIAGECIFTWYWWAAHRSIFADQTGVCDYLKVMLKRMPAAVIAGCHPPKH